jgi:hypothetical protein
MNPSLGISPILATGGSAVGLGNGEVSEIYKVDITNWYKALPYGFVFFNRAADGSNFASNSATFYLPISPQNINITTHFATNLVTTLFGVIEEHSEVRYYDIDITGTTGMAPRYVGVRKQDQSLEEIENKEGRKSFKGSSLPDLGGFLPEVTNTISQVLGTVSDIGNAFNDSISMKSGVYAPHTGYAAFHNFYKFLLAYKKDTSGKSILGNQKRSTHPIQFLNYKDKLKYDVVIQSFTLTRSAESPMLYNYNIKMRAFNLRNVDANPPNVELADRLGLGSIGGQSIFGSLASAAGNAATLVSGLL